MKTSACSGPANMELSLSRREDGLQEVQLTFTQMDTFMPHNAKVI